MSVWTRLSAVDSVELVELIRVEAVHGAGVVGDPIRRITEYWSKDGELLARVDPGAEARGQAS